MRVVTQMKQLDAKGGAFDYDFMFLGRREQLEGLLADRDLDRAVLLVRIAGDDADLADAFLGRPV